MSLNYSSSLYRTIHAIEGDHFWFRARNSLISEVVTRFSPKRHEFCEIGCGTGIILRLLSHLGYPVTGMDINKEAIKFATRNAPEATYIHKSLLTYSLKAGKRFRLVGAFDVLEHIGEDVVFLRHCHRLLLPGGLLFLTAPAGMWLWDGFDSMAGHERRYQQGELLSKIRKAGFTVVWWNYWQMVTLPMYWLWRLIKTKAGKRAMIEYLSVPAKPINYVLYVLLRFEQLFLMNFHMPIGASMIIVAKKV
jgi:SAM-dependent methyltransferase